MFEPTTKNVAIYNVGFEDGKALRSKKLINALRDARRFIRTVETHRDQDVAVNCLAEVIEDFTAGGEVETIEQALLELGVVA